MALWINVLPLQMFFSLIKLLLSSFPLWNCTSVHLRLSLYFCGKKLFITLCYRSIVRIFLNAHWCLNTLESLYSKWQTLCQNILGLNHSHYGYGATIGSKWENITVLSVFTVVLFLFHDGPSQRLVFGCWVAGAWMQFFIQRHFLTFPVWSRSSHCLKDAPPPQSQALWHPAEKHQRRRKERGDYAAL